MMKKLSQLFDAKYGVNLELVNCTIAKNGIPFVSRTSCNNGVVAHVMPMDGVTPNPANTLSLATGGSVLSCFYQNSEYYSGRDLFVLTPIEDMSISEMLAYSVLINQNKYKYNYGRQANKTFRDILLPEVQDLKAFGLTKINPNYKFPKEPLVKCMREVESSRWKWFRYDEIFDIRKGFYNKKPESNANGEIPFIGATDSNNGITSRCDLKTIEETSKTGEGVNAPLSEKIFEPNCITVSNNGSIGYAFYQPKKFTCTHDVNPLYLKGHELNAYIAMFLCTLIEKDRYRWTYGRKWRPSRMPDSLIKLPIKDNGLPDWEWMENYIKSLPYSRQL